VLTQAKEAAVSGVYANKSQPSLFFYSAHAEHLLRAFILNFFSQSAQRRQERWKNQISCSGPGPGIYA